MLWEFCTSGRLSSLRRTTPDHDGKTMRRTAAIAIALLIAATMLTGCGESDSCDWYLEQAQEQEDSARILRAQLDALTDVTSIYDPVYRRYDARREFFENFRDDYLDDYEACSGQEAPSYLRNPVSWPVE